MTSESTGQIEETLNSIRQRLLDLSLRNRLLNYRPRAHSIAITDELPNELFDRLVGRGLGMALSPQAEGASAELGLPPHSEAPPDKRHLDRFLQTTVPEGRFHRVLRRLSADARRAIDETGTNILYLAIGMLAWRDATDDHTHLAPLLLVPVEITRKRSSKGNEFRVAWTEEEIERNVSLAKMLSDRFGIQLPELPEEEPFCIETWITSVANAVGEGTTGDWEVRREAVVDLFSFARLFMYLDLDPASWPESRSLLAHPILGRLLHGGDGDFSIQTDRYSPELQDQVDDLPLTFDADSAQTTAILEAAAGKNLVIEGPPGTGKSQTISNLISVCLHEGKSVLFLSEKRAALEVVHQRLNRIGLTPFLLELHGNKLHRPAFIASLKARVELKYRKPRGLKSPIDQYRQTRRRLDEWASAIGAAADAAGTTVHDAFWLFESARMKLDEAGFDFPVIPESKNWDRDDLTRRREVCDAIGRTLQGRIPSESPWHGFWPRRVSPADRDQVSDMLQSLSAALSTLTKTATAFAETGALSKRPNLAQVCELAGIPASALQSLPTRDDSNLASGLASMMARQDAELILDRIERAQALGAEVRNSLPRLSEQDDATLNHLLNLMQEANNEGWDTLHLTDLIKVHHNLEKLANCIERLENTHQQTRDLGLRAALSMQDLQNLQAELAFWRNETPADASLYLGDNLFREATRVVYQQAQQDAEQVRGLRAQVDEIAWMDPRPDIEEIHELTLVFLEHGDNLTRFLFPRWRKAKRRMLAILKDPPESSSQAVAQFRQIGQYLTAAAALANNEKYQNTLGLLFQGESTSWEDGHRILDWGIKAAEQSSTELISQIVSSFERTKQQLRDLLTDVTNLRNELEACNSALNESSRGFRQRFLPEISEQPRFANLGQTAHAKIATLAAVATCCQGASKSVQNLSDFDKLAQSEKQSRDAIASVMAAKDHCRDLFGESFKGAETNISEIRKFITSMDALVEAGLPEETLVWLSENLENRRDELAAHVETIRNAWQHVVAASQSCAKVARVDARLLGGSEGTLQAASNQVRGRLDKIDELIAWSGWAQLREEAIELGLQPFIDCLEQGKKNTAKARSVFEWSRTGSLINSAFDCFPILQSVTGDRRLVLAERFNELEGHLVEWNVHRVRKACAKRKVPAGISKGKIRDRTELALIRREISKSRSYLPVRQLLLRSGKAMQALKPCFMMSPLAVARFLPHELQFDVLIVDEASQLRPEDCLGAIGRCNQIVVVGDPKQLPPTSFFSRVTGNAEPDSEQETAFDDVESILDVVSANLAGGRRLLWHYRSRHQDLIQFSNENFYDGSLTAFPTPRPRVPGMGVELRYLDDAFYADGSNLIEAQTVAAEAARLVLENEPGSIGIAAFNSRQRDLIEESLESLASKDPKLMGKLDARASGDEPLFIKNLENVQGDERDIMLLSFTYGPDHATAKVYQRFGPINSVGGWRRLNVLFTRARERVVVFTSLRPDQIRVDAESRRGVRALRGYLEFATMPETRGADNSSAERSSVFAEVIGDTLRESGLQSDGSVGADGCAIDLAVRDLHTSGAYALGVESDGEEFHANPVARERERIRPEVLQRLGWNLHLIHAPDWFRDRETVSARLIQAAEAACEPETEKA